MLFLPAPVVVVVDGGSFRGADGSCASRRELNEAMNSRAPGESPRRPLRFSAHASLERLAEYVMICVRDSSSSGRSWARRGTAHAVRFAPLMLLTGCGGEGQLNKCHNKIEFLERCRESPASLSAGGRWFDFD